MTIRPVFLVLVLGAAAVAQEGEAPPAEAPKPAPDAVVFTEQEILNFIETFESTYKNKDLPQEDAVATLANLKNAYNFLKSKGDARTKEELKLQKDIVALIAKKGLFARKRALVNLHCAQTLGELGDPEGAAPLAKWLEGILEEKSPNPQSVEHGFQSLAWIGPQDSTTIELVLDYATKGKHLDSNVAMHAIKACAQWRELDGKTRKDFFDKISMYLQGLHSKWKGGDAKQRGTYEQRYKAVETDGLNALAEFAGDGTRFEDPDKARSWFNDNKRRKWETYIGPRFRAAAPAAPAAEPKKEGGDEKPQSR
jgi:hypothetical protein